MEFLAGLTGKLKAVLTLITGVDTKVDTIDGLTDTLITRTANLVSNLTEILGDGDQLRSDATAIKAVTDTLEATVGGTYTTDPKRLPRFSVLNSEDIIKTAVNAAAAAEDNEFWTSLAAQGEYGTIVGANTYVTVASASGEGVLSLVVLPLNSGAAGWVSTVRITRDGETPIEISTDAASAEQYRAFLGAAINSKIQAAAAHDPIGIGCYTDTGWGADNDATGFAFPRATNITIPSPVQAMVMGLPVLYFETSLLVEVKCSVLSATTNDKRGGAAYRLF